MNKELCIKVGWWNSYSALFKRPEREVDHWPLSKTKDENASSYTCISLYASARARGQPYFTLAPIVNGHQASEARHASCCKCLSVSETPHRSTNSDLNARSELCYWHSNGARRLCSIVVLTSLSLLSLARSCHE